MKLFKPTYTDRDGRKKNCHCWYLTFTDNRGTRRRLMAFTNKRASEKAAEGIEELLAYGGMLSPDLQRWLDNLPKKFRDKLISFGVVDSNRISHSGQPLAKHLSDFRGSLLAKGNGQRYARQILSRLEYLFDECGFTLWSDIDANRLYTFLADLRGKDGIGERTFNCYLKAGKQFCRWMIKERRAMSPSPLEHLSCVTQTEKRRQRRALTIDEQIRLLEATQNGETHHNLTGFERYLVYKLALQTGLRANEIRHLTKTSFDFDERTVTVEAGYTKNKKLAELDLKRDTALELQSYLAAKLPEAKAFAMPDQPSKMIQPDLEAAGIEYKTDEGQADFHSLRHSFITNLARAGVHPSDAQALARHSSITLTMNLYTHTQRDSLRKIIDAQPDLNIRQNRKIG